MQWSPCNKAAVHINDNKLWSELIVYCINIIII